jgi:uncharacterized protein YciI
MPHFVFKLSPPRPTFALDMSSGEAVLMKEHAGYWGMLLNEGSAIVFGPVMDPKGPYGLGIAEFADEAAAKTFAGDDPVMKSELGFSYEITPMRAVTRINVDVPVS